MKRILGGSATLLVLAGWGWGEVSADRFQNANAAYAQGQFQQAVDGYEQRRSEGDAGWALSYNLGNAYFRTGQTGKAIASYLRAFRDAPWQADVIFNLNFVGARAGETFSPSGLLGFFWRVFYGVPLNVLAFVEVALLIGLIVLIVLKWNRRWPIRLEWVLVCAVVYGAELGWLGLRVAAYDQKQAVVIVPSAEARSAPNASATASFALPEGRRVLLLSEGDAIQGWLLIGVPQEGLKGWIPDNVVEKV